VGWTKSVNDVAKFAMVRYEENGDLDLSFGVQGKVITAIGSGDSKGHDMALLADGKIIVVGESFNGQNMDFCLVRYLSTGAIDTSFGNAGIVTTSISAMGTDAARSVAIQANGQIVVTGQSTADATRVCCQSGYRENFATVRYNADGSIDPCFSSNYRLSAAPSVYRISFIVTIAAVLFCLL
jgi:uncharacterized delta-60 repeat protein